ncbi:724_t:CDS:2 [Racocetra fulgida]|uniref:724_t:CDS:1 n=1 Tax=Racocetra fulgida TaxID=60492 RepID=A0A9N8ZY27_9GLOM|nr:724_t:CDS:2 [Racocetra fulgida]
MSNFTNNSTNQTSQPLLSQHTIAQINSSINDIITHLIDGGNPFTEIQTALCCFLES